MHCATVDITSNHLTTSKHGTIYNNIPAMSTPLNNRHPQTHSVVFTEAFDLVVRLGELFVLLQEFVDESAQVLTPSRRLLPHLLQLRLLLLESGSEFGELLTPVPRLRL